MSPVQGQGHFQWNAGGWFGGQLGSTVWLLVGAALVVPQSLKVAGILFGCFLLPNLLGLWLWSRRDRIAPYPAMQALIWTVAVFATVAFLTFDFAAAELPYLGTQLESQPFSSLMYCFLLIFPGLSLLFYLIEREARRQQARGACR